MGLPCSGGRGQGIRRCAVEVRWTPHPVIVNTRDNREYIRVLLYSYYTYHYYVLLQGGGSS